MRTLWKHAVPALAVGLLALGTAACGSSDDDGSATAAASGSTTAASTVTVKMGGGADNPLESDVLKYTAETIAPAHGVKLDLHELADSKALNEAVDGGDLDAHLSLHWPYLQSILAESGWKLKPVVPVYISLYSLRSNKHKTLDEFPDGATIAVPDDPTNQAIALNLLAAEGAFTIKDGTDPEQVTPQDIDSNPKGFKIKPLVSAQIPRSLDEVDGGLVQASYYQAAGIKPEGAIFTKPADAKYAITVIGRDDWESDPKVSKLVEVFKDPKLAQYINDHFGDVAIAANPA